MPKPKAYLTSSHEVLLRVTLKSIEDLLEHTAKGTPLYNLDPHKIADLNRTGKRFRSALQNALKLADQGGA